MMITLTTTESRVVLLNPTHVVAVKPRTRLRPSPISQLPAGHWDPCGAEVSMVNGERHNVVEDVEAVAELLRVTPAVIAPKTPTPKDK